MSMLAEMTWGQWALGSFLVFICFFLILVILLQKGRGGGFSGAFGGAGGSSTFGSKTGDVFTWITVIVAGVFVVLTVWSNFVFDESPRPKIASEAAQAMPFEIPLEEQDGAQPAQPIKMELGVVDPNTGERSTILVPNQPSTLPDGTATAGQPYDTTNLKPAESAQPPPVDESATPTKETPPEGEKKDDNENRPNP